MPRSKRSWISQACGSFHITSKLAGNSTRFSYDEKEYFLRLMEKLAKGFFVKIHTFCIMDNHFHILATGMEMDAKQASKEELIRRYKQMFGKNSEPPPGRADYSGEIIPDADGGIERLRDRLGSVSRFVQELKQTFSRWYNIKHDTEGYLWGGRFKGVLVYQGEAQLICSSYIDLNPVRAGIVKIPEDYRWSSMGMRMRCPTRASKLLSPLSIVDALEKSEGKNYGLPYIRVTDRLYEAEWYRQFVYVSGGIQREGKAHIPEKTVEEVLLYNTHFGITGKLRYRLKNFSESIAIGNFASICKIQETTNRKYIYPRSFLNTYWSYTTRVLRL